MGSECQKLPTRQKLMKINDFYGWIARIPHLSKRQRKQCIEELDKPSSSTVGDGIPLVIAQAQLDRCPNCDHDKLHKWGKASGLQRWKCMECSKTSNVLTGTPLARLRLKEKWPENAEAMIAGLTVRDTAHSHQAKE